MRGSKEEIFITDLIFAEVARAELKHPHWPKDTLYQVAVVMEEAGELMRAAVQLKVDNNGQHSADEAIRLNVEIRKEAIQTAAMCVRLLKSL